LLLDHGLRPTPGENCNTDRLGPAPYRPHGIRSTEKRKTAHAPIRPRLWHPPGLRQSIEEMTSRGNEVLKCLCHASQPTLAHLRALRLGHRPAQLSIAALHDEGRNQKDGKKVTDNPKGASDSSRRARADPSPVLGGSSPFQGPGGSFSHGRLNARAPGGYRSFSRTICRAGTPRNRGNLVCHHSTLLLPLPPCHEPIALAGVFTWAGAGRGRPLREPTRPRTRKRPCPSPPPARPRASRAPEGTAGPVGALKPNPAFRGVSKASHAWDATRGA